jgi:hypothetical protein
MRTIIIVNIIILLFTAYQIPAGQLAAERLIPDRFNICSGYFRDGTNQVFTPENMYEHINGEAELLKRYGATGLIYASFSIEDGDSVTVELFDLKSSENAYGLYRLYTGCDEENEEVRQAEFIISVAQTTSFAFKGNIFLRINTMSAHDSCKNLAIYVAENIFATLDVLEPYPSLVSVISRHAKRECDISYHPDEVDFERGFGSGYRWGGRDGNDYYLKACANGKEAKIFLDRLSRNEDILSVSTGKIVAWTTSKGEKTKEYLLQVIRSVAESKRK